MVTNNIETDLDITNGARGEIIDIILHPDEPPIDTKEAVVRLFFLPAYLVELSQTRVTWLEGLGDLVVPVEPAVTNYRIIVPITGKMIQRTVRRRQFSLTAAYAFTDYRSQGQTI